MCTDEVLPLDGTLPGNISLISLESAPHTYYRHVVGVATSAAKQSNTGLMDSTLLIAHVEAIPDGSCRYAQLARKIGSLQSNYFKPMTTMLR